MAAQISHSRPRSVVSVGNGEMGLWTRFYTARPDVRWLATEATCRHASGNPRPDRLFILVKWSQARAISSRTGMLSARSNLKVGSGSRLRVRQQFLAARAVDDEIGDLGEPL